MASRNCTQCGGALKGYFQGSVCTGCYSKNVMEKQRELLRKDRLQTLTNYYPER